MDNTSVFQYETTNAGHQSGAWHTGFGNAVFSPYYPPVKSPQDYASNQPAPVVVQSTGMTHPESHPHRQTADAIIDLAPPHPPSVRRHQANYVHGLYPKLKTEYNAEGMPIPPSTTGQLSGAAQLNQTDKHVPSVPAHQRLRPTAPRYQGQIEQCHQLGSCHQPYRSDLTQAVASHQPDPMQQQPYLSSQIYTQPNLSWDRRETFGSTTMLVQPGNTANISDYFALSVLVTVLFCWPFGVCALYYSRKVNQLKAEGKYDEARCSSKDTRTLNIMGIVVGVLVIGLIIAIVAWQFHVVKLHY